jgi:type IV pilus assembly protein PilA
MNKKGFTLVELLAVIVILAIILVIAIPNVIKIIDKAKLDAYNKNKDLIERAAKTYLTSNASLLPQNIGDYTIIKLNDLITNNYINNIKDPKNNTNCDVNNSLVKVENIGINQYKYDAFLQCDNYKTDITTPDISTTITGNQILVSGYDDNALKFTGNSMKSYINIPNVAINGVSKYTINYRILFNDLSLENPLLSVANSSIDNELIIFYLTTSNRMIVYYKGIVAADLPYVLQRNTIYDLTIIQNNTNLSIYINGNQVLNIIVSPVIFNAQMNGVIFGQEQDTVGGGFSDNQSFGGKISQIIFWNQALTIADVINFNNNINIITPTLSYKFKDNMGNVLTDLSGNKYNGTIIGDSATWIINSGVKQIRVKQGTTVLQSSNLNTATFILSPGTYTIEVEDNAGNISTKTITM